MGKEQAIEFLIDQHRLLTAQGLWTPALMGFEFVHQILDFPAFMITDDQVQGGSLHGIQQGGKPPMHLARVSLPSIARGGELPQVLRQLRMQAIFDHPNVASGGWLAGCRVTT